MNKITFNGYNFVEDQKTGYFLSSKPIDGSRIRLHRYVWQYFHGEIPDGTHVHHIDGDKSNNDISNLCVVSVNEHLSYHSSQNLEERTERFIKFAHPEAKKWHKSEEGREWHKEHWKTSIGKDLEKNIEKECIVCGSIFLTSKNLYKRAKFCSNKCKSQYRRDNALDKVEKTCVVCGKVWKTNKYDKALACSPKCRGVLHSENKKNKKTKGN